MKANLFQLTSQSFQAHHFVREMENHAAGAYTSFEGWVRNHNEGKDVASLEYEAYPDLALKEGCRILAEALEKFDIIDSRCIHRTGHLQIGEIAVWVGTTAMHRKEAFAACRYIIDEVKGRVPIWKKEHYADGDSGWVKCEHCASHIHRH
ncbi:MAG: molybdenum cofactor biosynthesis protein MoaE [Opitutae bacterium]|jgi:molybdopterin synthase catalytic subunit|nr:molybdenum cofactor biosynthesis protein MoaE [Opitutae bacterium]MBT6957920.1 molybdenum cofactor biosynthesis protein MoaE [Opitutae bacterium]